MKSVRADLQKISMGFGYCAAPGRFRCSDGISELLNFVPSIEKIGRGPHEILLVENSNRVFHVLAARCAMGNYDKTRSNTAVQPALENGIKKPCHGRFVP